MEVFEGKNIEDLRKEIYTNQVGNKNQIQTLIESLSPLIRDAADASVLVPLISHYLGMNIKNDEILLKLAQLVEKNQAGNLNINPSEETPLLSEEERKELLELTS